MQPYLSFDGNAAEALAFYARALGGQIVFQSTVGESPMASELPPQSHGRLMHACLQARGLELMASDTLPGQSFEGHKGYALAVQGRDATEGEALFDALSEGGTVTMPYGPTFWAQGFGMLVDRFGVPWMVNVDAAPPH